MSDYAQGEVTSLNQLMKPSYHVGGILDLNKERDKMRKYGREENILRLVADRAYMDSNIILDTKVCKHTLTPHPAETSYTSNMAAISIEIEWRHCHCRGRWFILNLPQAVLMHPRLSQY